MQPHWKCLLGTLQQQGLGTGTRVTWGLLQNGGASGPRQRAGDKDKGPLKAVLGDATLSSPTLPHTVLHTHLWLGSGAPRCGEGATLPLALTCLRPAQTQLL